jgi:hypothetical protein
LTSNVTCRCGHEQFWHQAGRNFCCHTIVEPRIPAFEAAIEMAEQQVTNDPEVEASIRQTHRSRPAATAASLKRTHAQRLNLLPFKQPQLNEYFWSERREPITGDGKHGPGGYDFEKGVTPRLRELVPMTRDCTCTTFAPAFGDAGGENLRRSAGRNSRSDRRERETSLKSGTRRCAGVT